MSDRSTSSSRLRSVAGAGVSASLPPADGEREIELGRGTRLDLLLTLRIHARGAGDAAWRFDGGGAMWHATRTSAGPATLLLEGIPASGGRSRDVPVGSPRTIRARAWGPGAIAALDGVPALVGLLDEPRALVPRHPVLAAAVRALPGLRLGRTGRVLEALVPAIIEQKITGDEARRVYRNLVGGYGEPAPGPVRLRLPPSARTLASLPYHAFHPLGLERRRADLIRAVAHEADRLERLGSAAAARAAGQVERDAAYAALRTFPGIGPWTAAEVGIRAFGDPDAVSVGDFHVPALVGWALARERDATDERMLELLEPFRGQRGRVQRVLELSGIRVPRVGPRLAPRRIDRL